MQIELAKQTQSAAASFSKRRNRELWAFIDDFLTGRLGDFFCTSKSFYLTPKGRRLPWYVSGM